MTPETSAKTAPRKAREKRPLNLDAFLGRPSPERLQALRAKALGFDQRSDRRFARILEAASSATNRYGHPDWTARLNAADQYFRLRGLYPRTTSESSAPRRLTIDPAPWVKAIKDAKAALPSTALKNPAVMPHSLRLEANGG